MTNEELMNTALTELGLEPDSFKTEKFINYLKLLKLWGKKINLTSLLDDKSIILKHFVDSLTVSEFLYSGSSVLDIGSGGGFPGVPLKIYNPSLDMTLMESSKKKVAFLKEARRKLRLEDLKIVCERAENVNEILKEQFDFVLFRAVGKTEDLLSLSKPYLKDGGKTIIMKAQGENSQTRSKYYKIADIKQLRLPYSGDSRTIIVYDLIKMSYIQ